MSSNQTNVMPFASGRLDLAGRGIAHLCVDMQRMFAEDTDWQTPWMERVLPKVVTIAQAHPHETIFTRFLPPATAEDVSGGWHAYYRRWPNFTRRELPPALIDLVQPLARFAPPAAVFDKSGFSPFMGTDLHKLLKQRKVDTMVITGAETDVCVLAAVLSAVDAGYFVVLPRDALCSSADETHDALMTLYESRFAQQIHLSDTETILAAWGRADEMRASDRDSEARRATR